MENYYEEKENTLVVIENKEIINSFVKVINSAKWVQGSVGVEKDPDYKIEIDKDSYLLWIDDKQVVMTKEEDNRTIFTLSNSSTKQMNEIIRQYLNPLN
jgi:HSP90 family molecular chaperone